MAQRMGRIQGENGVTNQNAFVILCEEVNHL
jgi:hypothetical protein